jgi:hypothetical protein
MIRDVAAAIGVMEGDASPAEHVVAGQQVFEMPVPAHGDDVRMFHDEQLIGNYARFSLGLEVFLNSQRFSVSDAAQVPQFARAARH